MFKHSIFLSIAFSLLLGSLSLNAKGAEIITNLEPQVQIKDVSELTHVYQDHSMLHAEATQQGVTESGHRLSEVPTYSQAGQGQAPLSIEEVDQDHLIPEHTGSGSQALPQDDPEGSDEEEPAPPPQQANLNQPQEIPAAAKDGSRTDSTLLAGSTTNSSGGCGLGQTAPGAIWPMPSWTVTVMALRFLCKKAKSR